MHLRFEDFLNDTPAAQSHRAQLAKAVVPDVGTHASKTAVDERERLIGEFLHAHPAETRVNAVDAVYRANEGLYARWWKEETLDIHGRRLSELYSHASGSFGVDAQGNQITKFAIDVEADIMRRAGLVLVKSAPGTTLDQAIGAVIASDPGLHQQWRAATFV